MPKDILTADIGGTSSRFALFRSSSELELLSSHVFETNKISSFSELLKVSEETLDISIPLIDYCVFAVAGPVQDGLTCQGPNISWEVDLSNAKEQFGVKQFSLVNDFYAEANAVLGIPGRKAEKIYQGKVDAFGPIAVVGAGTGLGKSLILNKQGQAQVLSSEGGHANFCPENKDEFKFQEFAVKELGHKYLIWDKVVSGIGLELLHQFLSGEKLSAKQIANKNFGDSETLDWFARFYGRVSRNYCLDTLSLGGLFVSGGIAAKNPELIRSKSFIESFVCSDEYASILQAIPVSLIREEFSGLWGAAHIAEQRLNIN